MFQTWLLWPKFFFSPPDFLTDITSLIIYFKKYIWMICRAFSYRHGETRRLGCSENIIITPQLVHFEEKNLLKLHHCIAPIIIVTAMNSWGWQRNGSEKGWSYNGQGMRRYQHMDQLRDQGPVYLSSVLIGKNKYCSMEHSPK